MSRSLAEFQKALGHTDRLIEGTKVGAGKPTAKEATMYAASVAFAYAAWEAYIEDVAIEAVEHLAKEIEPSRVPDSAMKTITTRKPLPTAWELTVHPGWRAIWLDMVKVKAKGDESESDYGINTARERQVRALFSMVGIDAFAAVGADDIEALDELVTARGTVVHAASTPTDFKKGKAQGYRDLVTRLTSAVDASLREQIEALTGKSPW